jgi:hypothetical protein
MICQLVKLRSASAHTEIDRTPGSKVAAYQEPKQKPYNLNEVAQEKMLYSNIFITDTEECQPSFQKQLPIIPYFQ